MKIIVVFGLPGTGKTFVGKVFQEYFDYHFYDGDQDLPYEMQNAIKREEKITDSMRDLFFKKIIYETQALQKQYERIIVAQTFIKEKYRNLFLSTIPQTQFIFVQTDTHIRETRLLKRTSYPLSIKYTRDMISLFESPTISHVVINNNEIGKKSIKKQIHSFISEV